MGESVLRKVQRVHRERGMKAIPGLAVKRLCSNAIRMGSVYFLDRNLDEELPMLRPVRGVLVREASADDLPLYDSIFDGSRLKQQARLRLNAGHRWFVALEESTGRLTNYRWVSTSSAFIPELNRRIIVAPGESYFYDLYTVPEFRRRGIEALTRQFSYEHLYRCDGIRRVIVYICADNHASLQAARHYLSFVGRVWYVGLSNGRTWLFTRQRDRLPKLQSVMPDYLLSRSTREMPQ